MAGFICQGSKCWKVALSIGETEASHLFKFFKSWLIILGTLSEPEFLRHFNILVNLSFMKVWTFTN